MLRAVSAAALLLSVTASAQSSGEAGKSQCFYFHPIVTIVGSAVKTVPPTIPVTYERELENAKSFTLQPTVRFGSYKTSDSSDARTIETKGIQLIAAYRNYLNGKQSQGLYLAPGVRAGYVSYTQKSYAYTSLSGYTYHTKELTADVTEASLLGYIGYRAKYENLSVYVDLGLGYSMAKISGDDVESVSGTGLAADANLGIGFNF